MNYMVNLTDEIQRYKESKKTQTLMEQFATLKKLILQANELEDIETVHQLVSVELVFFTTGSFSFELLGILDEIEALYVAKGQKYLTFLYATRGHIFHFDGNFEVANSYYKSAISYAMEYKEYRQMSVCMNNILTARFGHIPDELGFSMSKTVPLLIRQQKPYTLVSYYSKFFIHLEYGLLLNKIDYVNQILTYIDERQVFQADSRDFLQLKFFQVYIAEKRKDYEQAVSILQFIITTCIETKLNKDLLRLSYIKIIELNNTVFLSDNQQLIEQQYDALLLHQQQKDQLIQKYLQKQSESEKLFGEIGISKQQFEQQAVYIFQQTEGEGTTIVLIDVLLTIEEKADLQPILLYIEQQIQHFFAHYECVITFYDKTTIAFYVNEKEQQVEKICYSMFEQIRQAYPQEQSVVRSIYFAAVNNKHNNTLTYRESLELAKAYIYYELYK